jgi:hypothetical protein
VVAVLRSGGQTTRRRNGRKRRWSKRLRRWAASIRQIVETGYEKLHNAFGLRRERAHELQGLRARLAARVALHNLCIWLNEQLGRPRLTFADLLLHNAHTARCRGAQGPQSCSKRRTPEGGEPLAGLRANLLYSRRETP